jgi:hypothetical protein
MSAVTVRIIDPPAPAGAGPLERVVAEARTALAKAHAKGFRAAHADDVEILAERPDRSAGDLRPGAVLLESSGLPFAALPDYRRIVDTVATLRPGEPADEDDAWRAAARLDSPLDIVLAARDRRVPTALRAIARRIIDDPATANLRTALAGVAATLTNRNRQMLILAERPTLPPWPRDALAPLVLWEADARRAFDLDRPDLLVSALAPQADAAIVDTRLALATRLMRRRRPWPTLEDRFASDLLRPDAVQDPWLRDLTAAAATAGLPILLGGPSLVAWGIRLLLTGRRRNPVRAG